MTGGDYRDAWRPARPSYAERIRRGEHEGEGRVPGARFSAEELAAMREQALALSHLGATRWLPESEGHQPALFGEEPLEGAKEG